MTTEDLLMDVSTTIFGGARYISDVLEQFLGAGETRGAVRRFAVSLLQDLPASLRLQLEPVAAHIGAKCMGYPAVWFMQQLLSTEPMDAHSIITRCESSLCVSLSTSIVDDLADGDEPLDPSHVAYLYVLLGEAAFAQGRNPLARGHLHGAIDICLNPHSHDPDTAVGRRGGRIGAFFAMMAADVFDGLWEAHRAAIAVEATRSFGEICAHLDDWMDAERDLGTGTVGNISLAMLQAYLGGKKLTADDLFGNRSWVDHLMLELIQRRIAETAALLAPLETYRAIDALTGLGDALQAPQTFRLSSL